MYNVDTDRFAILWIKMLHDSVENWWFKENPHDFRMNHIVRTRWMRLNNLLKPIEAIHLVLARHTHPFDYVNTLETRTIRNVILS